MTIVDNADLVQILVPRNLVMDVYRFISEKNSSLSLNAPRTSNGVKAEELIAGWDAPLLKRLYEESDKNMRGILDHLAAHPGETVTASDLIHVLAQTRDDKKATSMTLGGTLGAFGRRVRNRYKRDSWPFEAVWSPEERQVHYRISDEVASQLRS